MMTTAIPRSILAAALTLAAFAAAAGPDDAPSAGLAQERPRFAIETDAVYDPGTVPAYAGEHAAVYAHIDDSIRSHTAALQRWLRQPSISAQNEGIEEMAEMLRDDLRSLGFQEAELVPTGGHPGVWAYYDVGAPGVPVAGLAEIQKAYVDLIYALSGQ